MNQPIDFTFSKNACAIIIKAASIADIEQAKSFLFKVQTLFETWKTEYFLSNTPFRMISCQLCMPSSEWPILEKHQLLCNALSLKDWDVLNVPTDHFYIPKNRLTQSEFFLKDVENLANFYNFEALSLYCYWVGLNIKKILVDIPLEALELYTLEAYLKHFIHEQDSLLLSRNEKLCKETHLKLGAVKKLISSENEHEGSEFEIQKTIMRARLEIQKSLKIRYNLLVEISNLINSTQVLHAELQPLKYQALILTKIMDKPIGGSSVTNTWMQQLMLMGLLHEELGVVTTLHGDLALDRVDLGYTLMTTLSSLKKTYSKEQRIEMALHWQELEKLRQSQPLIESLAMHLKSQIFHPFESGNADSAKAQTDNPNSLEAYEVNLDLLELIPIYKEILSHGKIKKEQLIQLDPTGKPIGLTPYGDRVLLKWFQERSSLI